MTIFINHYSTIVCQKQVIPLKLTDKDIEDAGGEEVSAYRYKVGWQHKS